MTDCTMMIYPINIETDIQRNSKTLLAFPNYFFTSPFILLSLLITRSLAVIQIIGLEQCSYTGRHHYHPLPDCNNKKTFN